MKTSDLDGLSPEASLLGSLLSLEKRAELQDCETTIQKVWLGMGEALSSLCYGLQPHQDQPTKKGPPIPTEAGRWRSYVKQHWAKTTPAEPEALIRTYHQELARQHHRQQKASV